MEPGMRLCLVEDNAVSALEPLTLTRPVFDLLLGSSTIGAKIARAFGVGTRPGPSGVDRSARTWPPSALARPAHDRQRPRLARPRPGAGGQRPLGPPGRLRGPGRQAPPGRALRRPARLRLGRPRTTPSPSTARRRCLVRGPGGRARVPGTRRRVDQPPLGPRRQNADHLAATSRPRASSG